MGYREAEAGRRALGVYYTPENVTDILCNWAIRDRSDVVLEPSFGGCEFIASACRRLVEVGCSDPVKNVFGADIDPSAFDALRKRGFHLNATQFREGDFLSLVSDDFVPMGVDAVVGNPPYVRHHSFSHAVRQSALRVRERSKVGLSMQANLWAFFVLHSCSFLREGGRVALVLPQNFLHATYSKSIHNFLAVHFKRTQAILVKEHLFEDEGASERSVLLLADGWSAEELPHRSLQFSSVVAVDEVEAHLGSASSKCGSTATAPPGFTKASARATPMGELCDIRIGLVTGDSEFFIFNKERAEQSHLDWRSLRPFISRAEVARGLNVRREELVAAFEKGYRTAILDSTRVRDDHVVSYINSMSEDKLLRNATFKKRPIWHQPFDKYVGEALFTSMSHLNPRIIINPDAVDCSNSLYRLKFKVPIEQIGKSISLSLISTFGQLSSEFEGRPYSSGLLKHEPSDVRRIKVFVDQGKSADVSLAFSEADTFLRKGEYERATKVADEYFMRRGIAEADEIEEMKNSLRNMRRDRLKGRV